MDDVMGKVTIAPNVLTTIVRLTALDRPGVHRLIPAPPKVQPLLTGGATAEGIFVELTEPGVAVELHVVASADVNMLKLGEDLQASITRAIEEMVGMQVASVDVHIDDVILPAAKSG